MQHPSSVEMGTAATVIGVLIALGFVIFISALVAAYVLWKDGCCKKRREEQRSGDAEGRGRVGERRREGEKEREGGGGERERLCVRERRDVGMKSGCLQKKLRCGAQASTDEEIIILCFLLHYKSWPYLVASVVAAAPDNL